MSIMMAQTLLEWLQETRNQDRAQMLLGTLLQMLILGCVTHQQTDVGVTGSENPHADGGRKPCWTQAEPSTEGELEHTWTRLRMAKTTKALANNVWVPTLMALCHKLGIPVSDPKQLGKILAKMGLVKLLGKWVKPSCLFLILSNYPSTSALSVDLQMQKAT
ncbi:hypothetical protein EDD16DRAFT_1528351 [Pisolithus croceorrhizus]|nr:hypothetical protein EV401DRAFT_1896298 [Pisolithus croceorrhizus]KAI6095898.1 hypothetical protein EDD16DRAFT_1528351 [Pisolithus croceorrhizus]KAI6152700.1 hypothetical protein EDD17DRAFT_1513268 [Pisolithus thermaeus]